MNKLLVNAFLFALLLLSTSGFAQQLAFPGAEGYGRHVTGGRGGRVVVVDTLADQTFFGGNIEGSFRDALKTPGSDPITIVFEVSGTIELISDIEVQRSNVTIAGQTAPGGGITIANRSVFIQGDNIIIQHLRFRPGDVDRVETSALNMENSSNVMIDHCSFSWSVEENAGLYDIKNMTVQWSIISEGLYDSFDDKGARGYGCQCGGQYATYHHNLFANNNSRTPRMNGSRSNDTLARVDFRNNVIFNWMSNDGIYGGEEEIEGGEFETNFINNYYKPGPASPSDLDFASPDRVTSGNEFQGYAKWYFEGNVMEGNDELTQNNWLGVDPTGEFDLPVEDARDSLRAEAPFDVAPVTTQSPQDAYDSVLAKAGAILPMRDSVDMRIINDVRNPSEIQGNGMIDSQSEVGGWPQIVSGPVAEDSDSDGIPDSYEEANGLNPNDSTDGSTITESGYSNLELYLHTITPYVPDNEGDTVTAIDRFSPENFAVYPVPAYDKVWFNSSRLIQKITLYNIEGKKVGEKSDIVTGTNNFFDISALPSGTYIINAVFKNGQRAKRKIVK